MDLTSTLASGPSALMIHPSQGTRFLKEPLSEIQYLETGNAFWLCWMLQNTFPLWFPWKAFAQLTFPHTYHAHNFTSPFWGNLHKCGLAWLVVTCWSWSRIPSCILFNSLTCTKPKQSTLPQPWHLFQRPFKKPALIKLSGSFITSRINNCINLRRLNWSV